MRNVHVIQPDINILGLRVQEPITSLTDLIIAAVCLYAWWRLRKEGVNGRSVIYLKYYFLTMAIATIIAGTFGHAFQYIFGLNWKIPGWYVSMVSITLIERSSIEHARHLLKPVVGKIFLVVNILELLTLMTVAAITVQFRWVEFHAVYGLLGVTFSLHLFVYIRTKNRGSKNMIYAIAVLVVAMVVFNYPIVPHVWFNHADLAHTLMAASVFFILEGGRHLGLRPARKSG